MFETTFKGSLLSISYFQKVKSSFLDFTFTLREL